MNKYRMLSSTLVVFLIIAISSCANFKTPGNMDSNGSATAGPAPAMPPQSLFIFPDLPIPVELEKDRSRTMMIKTQQFQGGIVVLRGRVTVDSLIDFFSKKLVENGWQLVSALNAKRSLLAFTKGNQGHCLIQVYETPGGFNTEVQIWLVEPMEAIQPPPPPPPGSDMPVDFPPAS